MSAYQKTKVSFILHGVKYKNIDAYTQGNNNRYRITLTGTASMIRQYLESKYNIYGRGRVWVRGDSFAGGDAINVYINRLDENKYNFANLSKDLKYKFQEGSFDGMTDSYTYSKADEKTEEGYTVDYGTKYLHVKNEPPFDYKDAPPVDWSYLSAAPKKSKTLSPSSRTVSTPTPSDKKTYPIGDILKDCSGWLIAKKKLPDGRIVYNAKVKSTTQPNKENWSDIKSEIYIETGFKWGKFGAFEKWGQIEREQFIISKLCEVLGKYYKDDTVSSFPATTPPPSIPATQTPPPTSNKEDVYIDYVRATIIMSDNSDYENITFDDRAGLSELITFLENRRGKIVEVFFIIFWDEDSYTVTKFNADELLNNNLLNGEFLPTNPNDIYSLRQSPNNNYILKFKKDIDKAVSPQNASNDRQGINNQSATSQVSEQDILEAIKGLEVLAKMGNMEAEEVIKGLKVLLSK